MFIIIFFLIYYLYVGFSNVLRKMKKFVIIFKNLSRGEILVFVLGKILKNHFLKNLSRRRIQIKKNNKYCDMIQL